MKKINLLITLLFLSTFAKAQNLDSIYVKFYTYSDYLKSNAKAGEINSNVYSIVAKFNSLSPKEYITETISLLKKEQFNEASFIFLLGSMRWKYYENFSKFNPEQYQEKDEIENIIYAFLRSNVCNFAAIIKIASQYHLTNDYVFCSRKKKPLYYDEAAGFYSRLGTQIILNEAYFTTMWSKERRDFENDLKK
ncbi:hypothetical protein [Flavobacterium sp.]|jgi:hypothetical protein|uniref:hypothetical protein n=1 Tax=Flavobacterium sp. TaxID=239 RepID=UPI0037BF0576